LFYCLGYLSFDKNLIKQTMPSYCSLITEVDKLPPQNEMIMFKPYFEVPDGCTSITVSVLLPSACYIIQGDSPYAPAGGACGGPADLQNTLVVNQISDCSDSTPTIRTRVLDYREDPGGNKLIIYVVDNSDSGTVKGGGKSKKSVDL